MRVLIFAISIFMFTNVAGAKDFNGILEKALNMLESGKYVEGVDYIYSTSKWIDSSSGAVVNLKKPVIEYFSTGW